MHRNGLTLDSAAEALGISRRMLVYYRNGDKSIPKHIWLACLGWECDERRKQRVAEEGGVTSIYEHETKSKFIPRGSNLIASDQGGLT